MCYGCVAAAAWSSGLNPALIARDIYFSSPLSKIRLLGAALSNLQYSDSLAWTWVTSRDLARFMLEGMARSGLTYDADERVQRLLAVIKRATHMLNRKGGVQDLWPE